MTALGPRRWEGWAAEVSFLCHKSRDFEKLVQVMTFTSLAHLFIRRVLAGCPKLCRDAVVSQPDVAALSWTTMGGQATVTGSHRHGSPVRESRI